MVKSPHILAQFLARSPQKVCVIITFVHVTSPPPVVTAERAVLIRGQDGIAGGGYGALWDGWVSILSRDQRLRQMAEVAVTLSGVCLCAFWTTLLYHLL